MSLVSRALRAFVEHNPTVDLRNTDFHDREIVKTLAFAGHDPTAMLEAAKAHQRLLRIAATPAHAEALAAAGFDSAHSIARLSERRFLVEHAGIFDGDLAAARAVHARAKSVKSQTTHLWANVRALVGSPHYRAAPHHNADAGLVDYFQSIPSYESLFGSLDYLSCPHCQSILGPAAYFVDVMRVVSEYITYPNTIKSENNIPPGMRLDERRPDLFDLPLTCDNTDTVIPFLRVVNEVLEAKIFADTKGLPYETVALAAYPFNLPFLLPLVQVRTNLGALGTSLAAVYAAYAAPLDAGQATSGSATTVGLAASASGVAGYYVGMDLAITEGPGAGQTARITAYDATTRIATVAGALAPPPDATSRYQITDAMDLAREQLGLSLEQWAYVSTPAPDAPAQSLAYGYSDISPYLYTFAAGAGTISFSAGDAEVTGTGTAFDTAYTVGDQLLCAEQIRVITAITSATALTVAAPWTSAASAAAYQVARWIAGPGRVTITKDTRAVIGDSDAKLGTRSPGDQLQIAGEIRTIVEIKSETEVQVELPWGTSAQSVAYTVNPAAMLENVATFLGRTGLTRTQLVSLLTQDMSPREVLDGTANRLFINDTGEGLPPLAIATDDGDPESPYQRIAGLSIARLDRLNRFIRLASWTQWAYQDLDWMFVAAGRRGITVPVVEELAAAAQLVTATKLAPEVVAAWWFDMKTVGTVTDRDRKDLFDRVYNNPALLRGLDPYTNPVPIPFDPARPLPWKIEERTAGSADAAIRSRLLGALAVADDDLTRLGQFVMTLVASKPGELTLDLANLSWLYRLATQARAYRLSVGNFLGLLRMLYFPGQAVPPPGSVPATVAGAQAIQAAASWIASSPFTVPALRYILSGEVSPGFKRGFGEVEIRRMINGAAAAAKDLLVTPASFVFGNIEPLAAQAIFDALVVNGFLSSIGVVLDKVLAYDTLAFTVPVTELSFVTADITAAESKAAFAELVAKGIVIAMPSDTAGTLARSFSAATDLSFLFGGDALKIAEAQRVLLQIQADIENVVQVMLDARTAQEGTAEQAVTAFVRISGAMLAPALDFTLGTLTLGAWRAGLLTPLQATDPLPADVVVLLDTLARAALWIGTLEYTPAQVAAVTASPAPFGITDTQALRFADLQALSALRPLADSLGADADALLAYFAGPVATQPARLAALAGWPPLQVASLMQAFWPPAAGTPTTAGPDTIAGVQRLATAFALGTSTGTDPFFLLDLTHLLHLSVGTVSGAMVLDAWNAYTQQASRTLDAVAARLGATEFETAYADITNTLDTAKRDALLGFTIWVLAKTFPFLHTPADLYQFLLLDVEMCSCATTSRIAQAISSVQLYMQRARMNLEAGVTQIDVDPVWWDWLSAYRVWEANRKIFLYPENYLQPGLRSSETPLFVDLVQQLSQSDLGEASVTDAFLSYFDNLTELASVSVTGAHQTLIKRASGDRDVLFVLARAGTDPYSYYYRTHDSLAGWSAWWKIDLSINSPYVTPVVAFDRLFLFWVELGTNRSVKLENTTATNQFVTDASIKYSFLSVNDRWVQPQTLVDVVPIALGPDDYAPLGEPEIKPIFDTAGLSWRQPYALHVARGMVGTGRAVITSQLSNFDGNGTVFEKELRVGYFVYCGGETRRIVRILDNERALVDPPWTTDADDAMFKVVPDDPQDNGFPKFQGAGTVSTTAGLANVSGTGTKFLTEVEIGSRLLVGSELRNVVRVRSDDELLVDRAWDLDSNNVTYTIVPVPTGAEQLLVMFGGPLSSAIQITFDPPDEPANDGRDTFLLQKSEFDYSLFYSLKLAETTRTLYPQGAEITVSASAQLDSDLNSNPSRMAIIDYTYNAKDAPRPFRLSVSRGEQIVRAIQSDSAIYDNYWGSSAPGTVTPPPAPGGSSDLLYNIAKNHATLFSIDNQPGGFLFDNGDETFWVRAVHPRFDKLASATYVERIELAEPGREGLVLSAGAYTPDPIDFSTLDFAFERISTSTVARLNQKLLAGGIERLLSPESQRTPELRFNRFYPIPDLKPPRVIPPLSDELDFNGAYGPYFREVFLFVPWYVATRLGADFRFEEAKTWLEYVFDPTAPVELGLDDADRYWRYLPFRHLTLDRLAAILTSQEQIATYNDRPFDPDAIAALRPAAYAKAVVLAYIRNLLAWADSLFAVDTRESIDSATQLYVLAGSLLGPRPQIVGECTPQKPITFREIQAKYGLDIPQFIIDLENSTTILGAGTSVAYRDLPFNDVQSYFCVPENSDLLALWDQVEDRMFKIRHCMNLQGVVRPLALFAPPIDPNALVRSGGGAADGLPRGSAATAPIPFYRFSTLVARAQAFTGQVMQLGSSMLAALEKRDAEALTLLRTSQERTILNLTTLVKEQQIAEATATGAALNESLISAQTRQTHYQSLIDVGLIPEEAANLAAMEAALVFNLLASVATTAASIGYAIPQVGSPFAMTYGGIQVGSAVQAAAGVFQIGSIISSFIAQQSLTMAGYTRREQDWQLQATLAQQDTVQITAQIAANTARQQIAQRDLEIHLQAIAQNKTLEQFLTGKFTNQQLYDWMAGRLAEVYFQAYQIAFDLARSAQRAYQFERGTNASFLDFTYWDSLRKGLLAGEGLMQSLSLMEKSYLDANRRPLEIQRTISLLQLDPKALLDLKSKGECTFAFPESLFDFDFPGQYQRRITGVSVSIPAVVGPFQNIKGTLTQLGNQVLLAPNVDGVKYLLGETTTVPDTDVLRSNWWANQEIALSRGVQDMGVFDPSPSDPRYLPFEGTGAVSTWRLSLPMATNHIAFEAIADVIIDLRYSALDGGRGFREAVEGLLPDYTGSPLLSFAQQYPDAWFAFLHDHPDKIAQVLSFAVPPSVVPPHIEAPELVGFYFVLDVASGSTSTAAAATPYVTFAVTDSDDVSFAPSPSYTYFHQFTTPIPFADVCAGPRTITFTLADTPAALKRDGYLDPAVVRNLGLVLYYRGSIRWSNK